MKKKLSGDKRLARPHRTCKVDVFRGLRRGWNHYVYIHRGGGGYEGGHGLVRTGASVPVLDKSSLPRVGVEAALIEVTEEMEEELSARARGA